MAYRTTLTLAALLVSTSIAGSALAQAVQTRTYDYEWLYFELPRFEGDTLAGKLFLEDVSSTGGVNARSVVDAEIFGEQPGTTRHDFFICKTTIPGGENIVQIGPFAQQATAEFLLPEGDPACFTPPPLPAPQTLEIDCPFRGLQINQAPGHDTFRFTGKYRTPEGRSGSYTATGQRGPIVCNFMLITPSGTTVALGFDVVGWIARVKETRTGTDVRPTPLWWHDNAQSLSAEDFVR